MATGPVITGCLNDVVLALTPSQRWAAAGKFNDNSMSAPWLIPAGIIAIAALTVLFFWVSFKRSRQERKSSEQLFLEYARKRGLSDRERQILLSIANKAGLKRNESIFTLTSAFERGVTEMKENFADNQTSEQARQLRTELSFLREKLGFRRQLSSSKSVTNKSKKLSSRQIPVGKTLQMIRQKRDQEPREVESTIVRNSDIELAVRLARPIKITFGELWRIRYCYGSSVWEFNTSVVSYDGDILLLDPRDNIRLINRRRFMRVPVKRQALVACFPFSKATESAWGPPEFIPAVVTELGGPGLCIESKLEVKKGERVLVILNLDEEQAMNSRSANTGILKMVEDIGEVRSVKAVPNGFSIAVELTGLSDSDVDDLVRVTNAASIKANAGDKNSPARAKGQGDMVKSVVVQEI